MNAELEAIKDAWDKQTGDGRDDAGTRALCDKYVAAHPDVFAGLDKFDIPTLVQLLSNYRDAGKEEEQWNVEVWLLHRYAAQNIGGAYEAQIRVQ